MENTTKKALIAGAGVAGLATAWWLLERGWDVTVVEKASSLRDGGYMMGISGPGLLTARRMGIVDALRGASHEIGENVYRDRRGRELLRIRYRELLAQIEWITLRRTDLVRVLADAVAPRCSIRHGTHVASFSQDADGVDAVLSDGTRQRVDLLVGAEGQHSELRARLFPSVQLEQLGYRYAAYETVDSFGLSGDFVSFAQPGHQAEFHGLGNGRMAALHVWRSADSGFVAPGLRHEVLTRAAEGSHADVGRILASLGNETAITLDDLSMVVQPAWHRGRVWLAGDAAHGLSLISGQGAGMALASAAVLAEELGRLPVERALTAHEARLRPVVEGLQARSRKLAPVYVPTSAWSFALRNTVMRAMPRVLLKRYFLTGLKSEAEASVALGLEGAKARV